MADGLSEQELDEIEARANALPAVHIDTLRSMAIMGRGNRVYGTLTEVELAPLINEGKQDILRLVAEVRRLHEQQTSGVEYRPGVLEDEVM